MSTIPHGFMPRSKMDTENWSKTVTTTSSSTGAHKHALSTLEAFDPFDELDHMMGRNMHWIAKPQFPKAGETVQAKVQQKYRVTVNCAGYSPKSIKHSWAGNVLTVSGKEESKCDASGNFHFREFKKAYTMPEHAECDKMVSFLTNDGQLCIEVPLKEIDQHSITDLVPKIEEDDGVSTMKLKFNVPNNIPEKNVHINVKDRCLVVKAEEVQKKPDGMSRFHYYKKTSLPENVDYENLECKYDDATHGLTVTAPMKLEWNPHHHLTGPMEFISSQ